MSAGRDDWLRDEVRAAAEAHRPDTAAIAGRVAARRAERERRQRWRPLTAGAGVAVVVAVSVVTAGAVAGESGPPPAAAPAAADHERARPESPGTTTPPGRGTPGAEAPADGTDPAGGEDPAGGDPPASRAPVASAKPFLTAAGSVADASVPTWTQNTVTVRTTRAVTGFRLVITVASTPGLARAGRFATVPNADLSTTVDQTGDALVYTYAVEVLKPGTYEFAAQFHHRPGRGGDADRFRVTARAGRADARQDGEFR